MTVLEPTILNNLIHKEDYARKIFPFLKNDYFEINEHKVIFDLISVYLKKYNTFPSKDTLQIELTHKDKLSEEIYTSCQDIINSFKPDENKTNWLEDATEKFCQDRALYLAITESISILDNKSEKTKSDMPQILTDALAISFDTNIGHDYIEDSGERFESYHRTEERIPFDIEIFNTITKGGFPKKTLNVLLGGTGGFKSGTMCHMASNNLRNGENVLYITLEMAPTEIAKRIDANLLDISLDELLDLPLESYQKKIQRVKNNTVGKLIVKEYPSTSAGVNHFRHLLNELKIKKNFIPTIIYIDYLNICLSSRMKYGSNVNSYSYVKSIAEEVRGLAQEFNVPIVTGIQGTRSMQSDSDPELDGVADSMGIAYCVDFLLCLISTEELEKLNQLMCKQLKNRYSDISKNKRFIIGVQKDKMRLYDVESSAQTLSGSNMSDEKSVFDGTKFGSENTERTIKKVKFSDFK